MKKHIILKINKYYLFNMTLPRIRKDFMKIKSESAKAICFLDFDKKEYWIPRSLCTLIKDKKDKVVVTIAAFKFEEITGIVPEAMEDVFISTGGSALAQHICEAIPLIESNTTPLYAKQYEIMINAMRVRHFALNADTGTGKTLMALVAAYSRLKAGIVDNIIVLCPANIKHQWLAKAKEYYPDISLKIFSIQSASFDKSYEKLKKNIEAIHGVNQVIIDESQMIKNLSALRTKRIDKLKGFDYVITCTATPIGRSAADLFYQFSVMDRAIIGEENYNQFAKHFLLLGGQDGEKIVAYQNIKQLSARLAPYIFRLTKKEIRPDMPEKSYRKVYYDMNDRQKRAYSAINNFIFSLQSKNKWVSKEKSYQLTTFLQKIASGFVPTEAELNSIFGNLGTLGEAAENVSKIKEIVYDGVNGRIEALKEIISEIKGSRSIIFARYLDEIKAITESIPNCGVLIGGNTSKGIQKITGDFENGEYQHLVISHDMAAGLDFPYISETIFFSTTYDWLARYQAEDRMYRINRSGDCRVWDIIARKSNDERIQEVLKYKQEVCNIFESK
ncbi:MAG TPA: DEAD/DEAH box helicase [Bacteroidales bacterium]|nr:DEAD/DEAH box helicase [Bacteroidales bacterium]